MFSSYVGPSLSVMLAESLRGYSGLLISWRHTFIYRQVSNIHIYSCTWLVLCTCVPAPLNPVLCLYRVIHIVHVHLHVYPRSPHCCKFRLSSWCRQDFVWRPAARWTKIRFVIYSYYMLFFSRFVVLIVPSTVGGKICNFLIFSLYLRLRLMYFYRMRYRSIIWMYEEVRIARHGHFNVHG